MASSSTSSEDEDLDKFREAIDVNLINDSMFKECKRDKEIESTKNTQLPSLRPIKDDQEQFNILNVTPEFQKYVAKCLSEHLEKQIQKKLSSNIDYQPKRKRKKTGVKLFSDSKECLSIKDNNSIVNCPNLHKIEIKKRTIENDSDISEDIKVKLCAVKSEDILNKKDVKYWTEHRKSEVFNYKRNQNGKLISVEKEFE